MAVSGRYLLHQICNGKTAKTISIVFIAGFSDVTWASSNYVKIKKSPGDKTPGCEKQQKAVRL